LPRLDSLKLKQQDTPLGIKLPWMHIIDQPAQAAAAQRRSTC
jgi:hypothetical protein